MTAEWDDLARLAEAATPGEWEAVGYDDMPHDVVQIGYDDQGDPWATGMIADSVHRPDAEFIAAANPATILRLITDNRNLRHTTEADLEYQRRLEARLAAVEALADEWDEKAVVLARQSESRAGLSDAAALAAASEFYAARAANVRAALAAPTDTTKEN